MNIIKCLLVKTEFINIYKSILIMVSNILAWVDNVIGIAVMAVYN